MDMFIVDSGLPHWEALLHSTDSGFRLSSMAALAWHLRENDSGHVEPTTNAPLFFMEQGIEVDRNSEPQLIEDEHYDATASEYAKLGDYNKADETSLKASAARAQSNKNEIPNRTVAMQFRHQTARTYTRAKYFKSLAAVEGERVANLQNYDSTRERLSAIGQEITAHIHDVAVFSALDPHVPAMLDAQVKEIWMIDDTVLRPHFGVEDSEWSEREEISLDHTFSKAVRCMKKLRAIYVQYSTGVYNPTLIAGRRRC